MFFCAVAEVNYSLTFLGRFMSRWFICKDSM